MSLNREDQGTGGQVEKPNIEQSGGDVYPAYSGCVLVSEDAMPAFMESEEENRLFATDLTS
jgi:hypothetical protein